MYSKQGKLSYHAELNLKLLPSWPFSAHKLHRYGDIHRSFKM